jgi:hypothetical protein
MIFSPAALGLKLISSSWGRYFIAALALLAALAVIVKRDRKKVRQSTINEIKSDMSEQTKEGRNAYHENRREAPRSSRRAIIDGMRGNDNRWGGV